MPFNSTLRPISKKRAKKLRQRSKAVRAVAERCEGMCEMNVPDVCQGVAVDPHELIPRSACGSIVDPANIRASCRACHDWVGSNRTAAYATGLLLSRYAGRRAGGGGQA